MPEWSGLGPHPERASEPVRAWSKARPAGAWRPIQVGDGERGPQLVELVATRVVAKTGRGRIGPEELPVVIRSTDEGGATGHDDYLSGAPPETLPGVLARVAVAEHRVERGLQRGKSEAGLADDQVRTWSGWDHHQALSPIAGWFPVQESRRGGRGGAGPGGAAGASRAGVAAAVGLPV